MGRFHYKQCWTTSNITKNSIRDRYKPISKNTKTLLCCSTLFIVKTSTNRVPMLLDASKALINVCIVCFLFKRGSSFTETFSSKALVLKVRFCWCHFSHHLLKMWWWQHDIDIGNTFSTCCYRMTKFRIEISWYCCMTDCYQAKILWKKRCHQFVTGQEIVEQIIVWTFGLII